MSRIEINEQKSVEILQKVLQESGLDFHKTEPGEEGGFFVTDENGDSRKLNNQEVFDYIFTSD